jgi:hypothetical protein
VSLLRDTLDLEPGVANEFRRIAKRAILMGRGGTVLIVSPATEPAGIEPPLYRFEATNDVLRDSARQYGRFKTGEEARGEDETEVQYARRRFAAERSHRDALEHVARLTRVDGAVVMTTDLTVLGYGTTITANAKVDTVVDVDPAGDGTGAVRPFATLGGHRHKSAAQFCLAQPPSPGCVAVAIVASQDRRLSFFHRGPSGVVHVHRPLSVIDEAPPD